MPVPGQPRNPLGQLPDRTMLESPRAYEVRGVTPATMEETTRGMILAGGQVRHLWRQAVNYLAPAAPYSWTDNAPGPNRPAFTVARGFQISRALRYLTQMLYFGAGIDNSRYANLHSTVSPRVTSKPVSVNAGQRRGVAVVRNRLTSFGARAPALDPQRRR